MQNKTPLETLILSTAPDTAVERILHGILIRKKIIIHPQYCNKWVPEEIVSPKTERERKEKE